MAPSKRRPGVNISAGTREHGTSGHLDGVLGEVNKQRAGVCIYEQG